MKTTLNQTTILTKYFLDQMPSKDGKKINLGANPTGNPYIVFDDHRDSPVGFGVKIGKTKKTYLIQRRVDGKVIKAKVGNVSDFANIDHAREAARKLAETMKQTGRNPNVIAREIAAAEITLGGAFTRYREYLEKKKPKAKPNTIKVFDKAVLKLKAWQDVRVRDLTSEMILERFDEIAEKTKTTAEQTFRWANVSVKLALAREARDARVSKREPTLAFNPFSVLHDEGRYRTRKQLEEDYKTKGIRSPLSAKDSLGEFLTALWGRRQENRTGCDYFLLTTIWGTRRNEGLDLKWRDQLSDQESLSSSWVCLKTEEVFFFDTKNRSNHRLPLCAAALEMVKQRWELNNERNTPSVWVFPARSKFSKVGHYTDGRSLLNYICVGAKINPIISNHDLRRTFGRIAEELVTYAVVKRLLNHQDNTDVTGRYTEVEESRLRESLQRIELHILMTAPTVYNALLTHKYPPLPT